MFEIVENNLMRKSAVKTLKLQNENYEVTFFYYGEYDEEMIKNGLCDKQNLSMVCKMKGNVLPIEEATGKIYVNIEGAPMLFPENIVAFKTQLDIAYASAIELEDIIKQYFGIC